MIILILQRAAYFICASTATTTNVLYTSNCLLIRETIRKRFAKDLLPKPYTKDIIDGDKLNLCSITNEPHYYRIK